MSSGSIVTVGLLSVTIPSTMYKGFVEFEIDETPLIVTFEDAPA